MKVTLLTVLSTFAEPTPQPALTTADLIALGQLIVGAVGLTILIYQVYLARRQLAQAVESLHHGAQSLQQGAKALEHSETANRLSHEGFVLNLRNSVSQARGALSDAKSRYDGNPEDESLKRGVEEKLEEFLNWMDHICKCLRAGLIPERDYKAHYSLELKQIYDGWSRKLQPGHAFPNIEIVFSRWRDNKDALDPETDRKPPPQR